MTYNIQAVVPLIRDLSDPLLSSAALLGHVATTCVPPLPLFKQMQLRVMTPIAPEPAVELLNAGARVVLLPSLDAVHTTSALCSSLSRDRLALSVTSDTSGVYDIDAVRAAAAAAGHLLLRGPVFNISALKEAAAAVDLRRTALAYEGVADGEQVALLDAIGLESLVEPGSIPLDAAVLAVLTTDRPDKLYTTLVTDERGVALGVCYSNGQSLALALQRRIGVYWSRKRGLWVKGETSGATQTLHHVGYDCDRDVLIFRVTQHAEGFCHRATHSCFGHEQGLDLLMKTLNERKASAPPGSYTRRLYDDAELLKKKLLEEAIELSQASEKDHVAAEAADLLYFALVACAKAGVSVADIEKHLDHRHYKVTRRPGDAKPAFLEAHMGNGVQNGSAGKHKDHTEAAPLRPALTALRRVAPDNVPALHRDPVDSEARAIAEGIMKDVREHGEPALRRHAEKLGDVAPNQPLILPPAALKAAFDSLPPREQQILQRTAERIKAFAKAQLDTVQHGMVAAIVGGQAGQSVAAVEVAGCYAPGGRYPLPSSVLMGAVTARVAGVKSVWVASPRPQPVVLAAAHVAGVDGLLAAGGAQAIAALAYGAGPVPVCDAIVGPGNRFVTAAKSLVAGAVAIDMLAGPSECLVVADGTANPAVVAADLLAQSEHDVMARAILVTPDAQFAERVDAEVFRQLAVLPTAATARVAIEKNSFTVITKDLAEAAEVSNRLAPEHLEVHVADAASHAARFTHYGALFLGCNSAEVFGDYGAGPNHTLPTGGTARSFGGLSVHTFLRHRTWLKVDDTQTAKEMIEDCVDFALMEGLHGHSRAAQLRLPQTTTTA